MNLKKKYPILGYCKGISKGILAHIALRSDCALDLTVVNHSVDIILKYMCVCSF